jgi:hypothetical protein
LAVGWTNKQVPGRARGFGRGIGIRLFDQCEKCAGKNKDCAADARTHVLGLFFLFSPKEKENPGKERERKSLWKKKEKYISFLPLAPQYAS